MSETRVRRLRALLRRLGEAFVEHGLMTYASAIAFRALVALVPLLLLGLGLLGALGLQDVWNDTLAPAVQDRVTGPVFEGIDFSVKKILGSGNAGLIIFASLLAIWDLTWAVRVVMNALNRIHGVEEHRPWKQRLAVSLTLAIAVGVCLVGAVLVVAVASRVGSGAFHAVLGVLKWLAAAGLLALAVGLLVRYAPAERPQVRWASAGSILVIGTWILASLVFSWWVTSVADFKTATGSLTVFLVLTAYVFTSSAIFLVGVELDELLRKDSGSTG
jgi:membrane protein